MSLSQVGTRLLRAFPVCSLPSSAWVDFLHLAARQKTVLRTYICDDRSLEAVKLWCLSHGLCIVWDDFRFICVGFNEAEALTVMALDKQPGPHAFELGLALGYPECCCKFVARLGESQIERLDHQTTTWVFQGDYRLISPACYSAGTSLICHIPCSPTCAVSLQQAQAVLAYLRVNKNEPFAERWRKWL